MKLLAHQKELVSEIQDLKQQKNAVILVHNYQKPEIYEIADFIGDSLFLCQKAKQTDADIIVFCGVYFMAETAAILNPKKKVVVPYVDAGCAMADMIVASDLKKFKNSHPKAAVVCYVNSTAEIKALSDICCTSANAVKVVKSLPNKEIIFIPDKNLALYIASKVPEKKIIPWDGFCPAHNFIDKEYLDEVRHLHPNAKIIAHPESKPEILNSADYVAGTEGLMQFAKDNPSKEFFVMTECGMIERLHREIPGKKFYGLCNMCFDMKKTTLESVLKCLKEEKPTVKVDKKIAEKALLALDKMLAIA